MMTYAANKVKDKSSFMIGLLEAAGYEEVSKELGLALHSTVKTSRIASAGTPQSMSSLRSSRIELIASDKL
jgi:hypothetical protein